MVAATDLSNESNTSHEKKRFHPTRVHVVAATEDAIVAAAAATRHVGSCRRCRRGGRWPPPRSHRRLPPPEGCTVPGDITPRRDRPTLPPSITAGSTLSIDIDICTTRSGRPALERKPAKAVESLPR
mmetsp:Transcript_31739/g.65342  ORF Transcript_31739/g.65342 Transcript_31739/m.65342 type:complete len:127 (-) Transcript_31739:629-1009(-)